MTSNNDGTAMDRRSWEAPSLARIGSFGDIMRGGSPGPGEGKSGMMDKN
jgi:hypothetical protein